MPPRISPFSTRKLNSEWETKPSFPQVSFFFFQGLKISCCFFKLPEIHGIFSYYFNSTPPFGGDFVPKKNTNTKLTVVVSVSQNGKPPPKKRWTLVMVVACKAQVPWAKMQQQKRVEDLFASLKLTASLPLKMDGWNTIRLPFWGKKALFSGAFAVSFRECNPTMNFHDAMAL